MKTRLSRLVIVAFCAAAAANPSVSGDFNSEPAVTVRFGDVVYRIPRTYLPGITPFKADSPEGQLGSGMRHRASKSTAHTYFALVVCPRNDYMRIIHLS
jgi:hypothetical protein